MDRKKGIFDRTLGDLNEKDIEDIDEFDNFRDDLKEAKKAYLQKIRGNREDKLEHHRQQNQAFESRLNDLWGDGFDLLEAFILLNLEAGEIFNDEYREDAAANDDYVFDALVRLHARGCRIAREMLTLLTSGYTRGTWARWRALHETVAVAMFIRDNGQDTAERYLLHAGVLAAYAAEEYNDYERMLNYNPIEDETEQKARELRKELVNKFGIDYKSYYGWAEPDLDEGVGISNIIEAVDIDHLKPYERVANYSIHPSSIAVQQTTQLDLREDTQEVLPAGPTNANLHSSAQMLAISLNMLTTTMLLYHEEPRWLVVTGSNDDLIDELTHAFLESQVELEDLLKEQTHTEGE